VTSPPRSLPESVVVGPYTGRRADIRHLFELAEDSASALDSYLDDGDVLVASQHDCVIGHIQITRVNDAESSSTLEIKNMAVEERSQGKGIGSCLISAAIDATRAAGSTSLRVATAAADTGNLRFYQRQGFRFLSVERDAFSEATGYPGPIVIDGIELRDRVWLDRSI